MGCWWAGRESHLDRFPFSISSAYLNFCNTDRKREKEKSKRASQFYLSLAGSWWGVGGARGGASFYVGKVLYY